MVDFNSKLKKKRNKTHLQEITPEMVKTADDKMEQWTEEMIDLPMLDFCRTIITFNVGEIKAFRLYLEQRMLEVDSMCNVAMKPQLVAQILSVEERVYLASLFVVLAKIEDKRGFVDYVLMEREAALNMDKK
jgi:hypothetical protein